MAITSQTTLGETVRITDLFVPEPKVVPYAPVKRAMDVIVSLTLLALLFPTFIIISVLVRLNSPGPALYKCERIGLCGQPFWFLKFRSMYVDADARLADLLHANEKDGPIFKMKNDPRVTPVGRFLRKYSLDELPQILTVLIGDMSLVGPRPPLRREVERYDEYCMMRLTVKPGITCFWQIMGRSNLTFDEWMELDHRYLREMSLMTDVKILVRTPSAVFKGDGAC